MSAKLNTELASGNGARKVTRIYTIYRGYDAYFTG